MRFSASWSAVSALVVGLGLTAAPSTSWAQAAPPGSYQSSCRNVSFADGILHGLCRRADQSERDTNLVNPGACNGDIVNQDGRLVCGSPSPNPYIPVYADTRAVHYGFAKYQDHCFGSSYFIIRPGGSSRGEIRFHLGLGEIAHFELPDGSTSASACGGYPSENGGWDSVDFE